MTEYSIWPNTDGPLVDFNDGPYNLGTQFRVSVQAWLTAIRFWRGTTNIVGPISGRLWKITGASSGDEVPGSVVNFNLSGVGWQKQNTDNPVELTSGQDYRVAITIPSNYSATSGYWTSGPGSAGITSGIISAPNTATAGQQGSFIASGSPAYPTQTFGGGNYWVDIVVSDVFPVGDTMASIADQARTNMLVNRVLTEPRKETNPDLMKLVLDDGSQTLVTKTDANAATHLMRYMMGLR